MAYVLGKAWTIGESIDQSEMQSLDDGVYDTHYANAGAHNSIFRGKSLGTAVTATQAGYISGGTFYDLFVGDYWTINSAAYRIGGFNYWFNCGSSALTTTNHAIMVPNTAIYQSPMNATNSVEGAYVGSAMYTCEEITVSGATYTGLANMISTLESAFGSYLLSYEGYYANASTNGYPSAGAWCADRVCDLMTEQMVYGSSVMQQMSYSGAQIMNRRIGKSQLPIFALAPELVNIRLAYWLQDLASSTYFAIASNNGLANAAGASSTAYVRPFFLIS